MSIDFFAVDILIKKSFSSKSALDKHLITHNPAPPPHFMCLTCSREFFQKYQLENHKNVHDPDKEFRCSYPRCSHTYRSHGEYNHHCRSHCGEYADFKCKDCNKTYTGKKSLDQHMVLHTEVLKEVCKKCGKRFHWRSSLRVHIWVKHPSATPSAPPRPPSSEF